MPLSAVVVCSCGGWAGASTPTTSKSGIKRRANTSVDVFCYKEVAPTVPCVYYSSRYKTVNYSFAVKACVGTGRGLFLQRNPTTPSNNAIQQRNPTTQSNNAIQQRNPTTPSYNAILQRHPTTRSYNAILQRNHATQSHNAIPQRNHITQSNSAIQ